MLVSNDQEESIFLHRFKHLLSIDILISSFQLKELARNFLTNFGNVHGRLLLQSPRQSGSDRRLTEVLVHFLIVMKCFPQNRVLQPLANLACNPALMTVRKNICTLRFEWTHLCIFGCN
jgi:hypothetical protein